MQSNPYLSKHFSIWRDAEQLMVQTEQAVRQFSHCPKSKSKYSQDLPKLAKQILSYMTHAINRRAYICHCVGWHWIECLVLVINKLKLTLTRHTAKPAGVFVSFKALKQLAMELGETLC